MAKLIVQRSDDSQVITLPGEILERHGWKDGDWVYLFDRPGGVLLTSDPGFVAAVDASDEITERYRGALQRLADS
jgi:bifunctional DNA-binding transcriptional regulator/antitoxin component of YhaV-PrlF toxin-antitoxin module